MTTSAADYRKAEEAELLQALRQVVETVSHLSNWFEDYNEVYPHKALQLKSPREFIRSHLQPAACPV